MAITIDEALDLLSFAGAELVNGNANHGPMAAEALFAMGREDAVQPWIDGYRNRLTHRVPPTIAIPPAEWRDYLGARNRLGDWVELFENELSEQSWQDVVKIWAPRLAPGLMGAATHGLIRASHAVRSIARTETPQRRRELAQGLGFWAASYYTLPGSPSQLSGSHSPGAALGLVDRLHGPDFDGRGSIAEQIRGMENHPEFEPVIDLTDTGGDLSSFISNLTATFAGIYLASSKDLIAFVHTVTAPSALRMLVPYLEEDDAALAARYAWQACAAIYSWYSTVPVRADTRFQAAGG